jgi:hypothetical protein
MMKTPEQAHRQVLDRLAEALSGRMDLEAGATLFEPDVIVHMDRYTFTGVGAWQTWVAFIRSRPGMADLQIDCDGLVVQDVDTVTAYGHWRAGTGPQARAMLATATYRFHEGRIAELWTTRSNYEMMFGPLVRWHVGLLLVFARLLLWMRLSRRQASAPAMLREV